MTDKVQFSSQRMVHFCINNKSPTPLDYNNLTEHNVCEDCWGIFVFCENDYDTVPENRKDMRSYHCPARYRCCVCNYPCSGMKSKCSNCKN